MVTQLISKLIAWALFLGMVGGLVDTTIAIRHHAMDATRMGLVSLTRLNHQLLGNGKPSLPKSREHRTKPKQSK